jgi:hypothetical protein
VKSILGVPCAFAALALIGSSGLRVAFARPPSTPVTVQNPNFAIPAPAIPLGFTATTYATCPLGATPGPSASKDWTTYANTFGTSINSWLVPGPAGRLNNLVATGGAHGGLVQVLAGQCRITDVNRVFARVYVVAGKVTLEIGDGGSGSGLWDASAGIGAWEELSTCGRPDMLNNEITIYGAEAAVFYADKVGVGYDPSCLECAHPAHIPGEPLAPECGACEASICAIDPFCCASWWDDVCVSHTTRLCPTACPPE